MQRQHAIIGVPALVRFQSQPCTWTVGAATNVVGKPLRLFAIFPKLPFSLTPPDRLPERPQYDAWQVREAFLDAKSDEAILDFLNTTGRFSVVLRHADGIFGLTEIRQWQRAIRDLLTLHPREWNGWIEREVESQAYMHQALLKNVECRTDFWWDKNRKHYVLFDTEATLQAMLATVKIDHLRNRSFEVCTRPDCGGVYEITSAHKRAYCSQYCAHVESQRRRRNQQRAARKLEPKKLLMK